MNNKYLIIIILAVVLTAGVGGYFLSRPACPASCDDNNSCTIDTCSKDTDYECSFKKIPDCCGNKSCEVSETYQVCPTDCPNCDDDNKCTKDDYDYHEQKCVNKPILDTVCCGNAMCEISETYETCAADCKNCNDDNECTKDSFDYHQQQCLNEIITPCCGNKKCDKGAETNTTCSADCPSCDDQNKLTSDSFNYESQKCENILTHYFFDDFESGSESWSFFNGKNGGTNTTAWTLIKEGANTVLKGTNHNFADLAQSNWNDYILKLRFKKISGTLQINFRNNFFMPTEEVAHRYMLRLDDNNQISLDKGLNEQAAKYQNLGRSSVSFGTGWNTLEIRAYRDIINIYLNKSLIIEYRDLENPFLSGKINFETQDNTVFLLDNVEVKLITAQDIVNP
ncbi:MAG: family 16 glycoside hydrolase [Minisyncoccia bacterium]